MIKYNGELIPQAKKLRKEMTPQERHLWYDFLRNYQPKFVRQKSLDNCIVDFYCHQAHLAIEVDGSQHYEDYGKQADAKRTALLERYGIKVLRYSNYDVNVNFYEVCESIDHEVKERLSSMALE